MRGSGYGSGARIALTAIMASEPLVPSHMTYTGQAPSGPDSTTAVQCNHCTGIIYAAATLKRALLAPMLLVGVNIYTRNLSIFLRNQSGFEACEINKLNYLHWINPMNLYYLLPPGP